MKYDVYGLLWAFFTACFNLPSEWYTKSKVVNPVCDNVPAKTKVINWNDDRDAAKGRYTPEKRAEIAEWVAVFEGYRKRKELKLEYQEVFWAGNEKAACGGVKSTAGVMARAMIDDRLKREDREHRTIKYHANDTNLNAQSTEKKDQ